MKFQAKLCVPGEYKNLSDRIYYPVNSFDAVYVFIDNDHRHYDNTLFEYYIDGMLVDWIIFVEEFNKHYSKEEARWHYVKNGRDY